MPRGNSKRKTFFFCCCNFQLDINSQKALGLRIGILDIARALWFRWKRNPRGAVAWLWLPLLDYLAIFRYRFSPYVSREHSQELHYAC